VVLVECEDCQLRLDSFGIEPMLLLVSVLANENLAARPVARGLAQQEDLDPPSRRSSQAAERVMTDAQCAPAGAATVPSFWYEG
jgi:hypothetical protein